MPGCASGAGAAEGMSGPGGAGRRADRGGRASPPGSASPSPMAARPDLPSAPSGMARPAAPPPRQVVTAAIECLSFEEKQLPNERETVIWKPRKECWLKNVPNVRDSESEESEFSDTSHNENDVSGSPGDCVHTHSHLEDLGGEVSDMPEAVTFPELQTAAVYEAEDWEGSECDPYDADDIYCGSFQENNLLASYPWQKDSFYDPSCHHAACRVLSPPVRMTEAGQFDDADE